MQKFNIIMVAGAVIGLNAALAAVLLLWPVASDTEPLLEHPEVVVREGEDGVGVTDAITEDVPAPSAPTGPTAASVPAPEAVSAHATQESVTQEPGTTYVLAATEEGTVLDVMNKAVEAGSFSYRGRTYPGIGLFVEEIGGLKNEKGMFWILYINGETSDRGVSSARVVPGDMITWQYEKSIF